MGSEEMNRVSPHRIDLPLVCGIQETWEQKPCGGKLYVIDHRTHDEWRYEVTCEKCLTCDPNGYPRQDQLIDAALLYFSGKPKP